MSLHNLAIAASTAPLAVAPQQQENSQSSLSSSMPAATLDVAPTRMTCNRWIFNVDTGLKEKCGKTPIVLNAKKQHYCKEHSQQRCVFNKDIVKRKKKRKKKQRKVRRRQ